jgi:hypothetical protein
LFDEIEKTSPQKILMPDKMLLLLSVFCLLPIACCLLSIACCPDLAIGYWLLSIGYCLLAIVQLWLLAIGYWLEATEGNTEESELRQHLSPITCLHVEHEK